ncbi:MAG: hypothetical protein ACTSRP_09575 [Candidatus Helarchaeota archaeon]
MFADLVIKLILELQKISPLNINEIDRFMTYFYKTNKSIKQYKEEISENIEYFVKDRGDKGKITKVFLKYCDDLEKLYLLNYILISLNLFEYLNEEKSQLIDEIIESRTIFQRYINSQKELIKYYLAILIRKIPDFYI